MIGCVYVCAHCGRQSLRVLRCEEADRVQRACEVARNLPWQPDGFFFTSETRTSRLRSVEPESVTYWFVVSVGMGVAKAGDVYLSRDGDVLATLRSE